MNYEPKLPMCACDEFYDDHHPECPVRRELISQSAEMKAKDKRIAELERLSSDLQQVNHLRVTERDAALLRLGAVEAERDKYQARAISLFWRGDADDVSAGKLREAAAKIEAAIKDMNANGGPPPVVEDQWRSNCMGRKGSGMDEDPCQECDADNPKPAPAAEVREPDPIRRLVDEQAEDAGLWFEAQTAAEGYLQQALRRLHAAIEGVTPEECAKRVVEELGLVAKGGQTPDCCNYHRTGGGERHECGGEEFAVEERSTRETLASELDEWKNNAPGASAFSVVDAIEGVIRPAAVEERGLVECTCPGWCFFNPGQHHANCQCKATDHTIMVAVGPTVEEPGPKEGGEDVAYVPSECLMPKCEGAVVFSLTRQLWLCDTCGAAYGTRNDAEPSPTPVRDVEKRGPCPTPDCPYADGPDFSIGNPCRCL